MKKERTLACCMDLLLLGLKDFSLPLKDPVLLFSLLLFIILFAPILLNKLKIPHLIGLIIAGALIGPNGFNLMLRDSSIVLFGTVGLLYIMFLAGLEIDIADFKKNSGKSFVFGMLTFLIPMGIGTLAGLYWLNFELPSAILLASMFASHTLITYPIVSKFGVIKNKAVNITVGGTMITDTLALLVLAVIVGMSAGEVNQEFWIKLGVSVLIFGLVVMLGFPIIGRWFFKRFDDRISQYIFVLAMVFMGAFLAELAGVEPIIGAFLAGLALNRLIPHTSPLMNRIEFVGNALFIPFFLIGVGMLIDYKAFFKDLDTINVAMTMTLVALISKFLAAWATQKVFKFSSDERRLIFGLSNAQAAATLAAVLVGYNIITDYTDIKVYKSSNLKNRIIYTDKNEPLKFQTLNKYGQPVINSKAIIIDELPNGTYFLSDKTKLIFNDGVVTNIQMPKRLLGESVLNGSILMILVTCTIASFVTQRGAQNLALLDNQDTGSEDGENDERILLAVNEPETVGELVNLSIMVKSKSNRKGLYALNVIDDENGTEGNSEKTGRKLLDKAIEVGAATDNYIHDIIRYDLNVVNGITQIVKEQKITDLILGLNDSKGMSGNFLGNLSLGILTRCNTTTLIYKPSQPLSTIKRHLVIVPDRAEREMGFPFWLIKVWNIARNSGSKLVFYAPENTLKYLREIKEKHPVEADFVEFSDWNDFLILSRDVKRDDNLIVVMSRKDRPSYHHNMTRVPGYLNKYFKGMNYLLIYPMQLGVTEFDANDYKNPSVLESIEKLDEIGKTISGLFKRK